MKNTERSSGTKNLILDTAARLFMEKGYEQTSVNDILKFSSIARGSLYYHYKSKEDVLDGVLGRITEQITVQAKAIADDSELTADEKMMRIISSINLSESPNEPIIQELHKPANALLHQKSITQTIQTVAPLIAGVVRQGVSEGIYHTEYPLETIEILLVAGQFIFDEAMFERTAEETAARMAAFINIVEAALGAERGSFGFWGGIDSGK
ncbi:MAG: TetR/AcrR family transcriptional regulator [Oscillospiraceae bacterium]|nr:TetR/AcrR family transcriptional regulator [Oscillospiraceae bacterium]